MFLVTLILQGDGDSDSPTWKARAAVLHLMAATLQQSPSAARSARQHEAVLLVLFGLLEQPLPRKLALHMVTMLQTIFTIL